MGKVSKPRHRESAMRWMEKTGNLKRALSARRASPLNAHSSDWIWTSQNLFLSTPRIMEVLILAIRSKPQLWVSTLLLYLIIG